MNEVISGPPAPTIEAEGGYAAQSTQYGQPSVERVSIEPVCGPAASIAPAEPPAPTFASPQAAYSSMPPMVYPTSPVASGGFQQLGAESGTWTIISGPSAAVAAPAAAGTVGWRAAGPHTGQWPNGYQGSDERIWEDVCECLTEHGDFDASDIESTVADGEVTLMGSVDRHKAMWMAEETIEQVRGADRSRTDCRCARCRKSARRPNQTRLVRPAVAKSRTNRRVRGRAEVADRVEQRIRGAVEGIGSPIKYQVVRV
jgi:hypothetical protein